jgi:hypothetical protein
MGSYGGTRGRRPSKEYRHQVNVTVNAFIGWDHNVNAFK